MLFGRLWSQRWWCRYNSYQICVCLFYMCVGENQNITPWTEWCPMKCWNFGTTSKRVKNSSRLPEWASTQSFEFGCHIFIYARALHICCLRCMGGWASGRTSVLSFYVWLSHIISLDATKKKSQLIIDAFFASFFCQWLSNQRVRRGRGGGAMVHCSTSCIHLKCVIVIAMHHIFWQQVFQKFITEWSIQSYQRWMGKSVPTRWRKYIFHVICCKQNDVSE